MATVASISEMFDSRIVSSSHIVVKMERDFSKVLSSAWDTVGI